MGDIVAPKINHRFTVSNISDVPATSRIKGTNGTLSLFSTALNTGFATFSEPKTAVNSRFEPKMIAFKKEDPVLKRSNKILTGVENRLSWLSYFLLTCMVTEFQ